MANPIVENIAKTNADALAKEQPGRRDYHERRRRDPNRKRQRVESGCSGVDNGVSGIGDKER